MSFLFLCGVLEGGLVAGQGSVPERVELVAEGADGDGVQPVDVPPADCFLADQAGVFQHFEMLRDGWPTHWQARSDLDDCERLLGEVFDDRPSGRVAQDVPDGILRRVS